MQPEMARVGVPPHFWKRLRQSTPALHPPMLAPSLQRSAAAPSQAGWLGRCHLDRGHLCPQTSRQPGAKRGYRTPRWESRLNVLYLQMATPERLRRDPRFERTIQFAMTTEALN